jgi:hypothetical protein
MFRLADVATVLRTIRLKLEDGDDDNENQIIRVCEAAFRIPLLSHDLATAIVGVPVARHCYGPDGLPLWEVNDVRFTPPESHFLVSVKSAPDMPGPLVEFVDTVVDGIRVWRPKQEKRDLSLEFVTRHELARGDAKDLAAILTAWEKRFTYVTLTEIRPPLFEDLDTPQPRTGHTH